MLRGANVYGRQTPVGLAVNPLLRRLANGCWQKWRGPPNQPAKPFLLLFVRTSRQAAGIADSMEDAYRQTANAATASLDWEAKERLVV